MDFLQNTTFDYDSNPTPSFLRGQGYIAPQSIATTKQKTLAEAMTSEGIGLHSGRKVRMTLHPACVGTGIQFRRQGRQGTIEALWHRVGETTLGTTLVGDNGHRVATVEHLMAALAGCHIDNLVVELNDDELPAMDGSSEPFVDLLMAAGTEALTAQRSYIKVLRPVRVEMGTAWAVLEPSDHFSLDITIDFDHALIKRQRIRLDDPLEDFGQALASARTFGFLEQVEMLRANGFALGGDLNNAIVIDQHGVVNPEGLRFDDEFVRHKALDAIGDLALAGAPLIGRLTSYCPGHKLNNLLLRALFADTQNWAFTYHA